MRPGRPLELQVNVMDIPSGSTVDMHAGLQKQYWDQTQRKNVRDMLVEERFTMNENEQKQVSLMVPADLGNDDQWGQYYLFVNGEGGLTFTNESYITFNAKTKSVFVQTDKGIYKPGQTVKFRAMAIFSDLKTLRDPFDIIIKDPQGTKMKQWLRQEGTKGVVSKTFDLSDQTVLGDWEIYVETTGITFSKKFTVEEYVLPKFEVSVKAPSFHMAKFGDLKGTIQAKYTYGQPVIGTVSAVVQIKPQEWELRRYSWQTYSYVFTKYNITGELVDGKLDFTLTPEILSQLRVTTVYENNDGEEKVEEWIEGEERPVDRKRRSIQKRDVGAPGTSDSSTGTTNTMSHLEHREILISATVTETLTEIQLVGNGTVPFKRQEYAMSFMENTPSSFKHGLDFTGFLKVARADGTPPLSEHLVNADGSANQVSIEYRFDVYTDSNRLYNATTDTSKLTVDASGLVSFTVRVPKATTKFEIYAEWKSTPDSQLMTQTRRVNQFESEVKQGIQVAMDDDEGQGTIKGETRVTFNVEATEQLSDYYYALMSKGLMVAQEHIVLDTPTATTAFELDVTSELARELAPTGRLLVWYFSDPSGSSEMIVDSVTFSVDGIFANDVSIAFSTNVTEPGQELDLTVRADPDSFVGILALDQSVLLLNSGNDITESMVEDELRQYDSSGNFYPYYRGGMIDKRRKKRSMAYYPCCWPMYVSGEDATEVLANSGVIVFTDGYIHNHQDSSYP